MKRESRITINIVLYTEDFSFSNERNTLIGRKKDEKKQRFKRGFKKNNTLFFLSKSFKKIILIIICNIFRSILFF